MHPNPSLPPLRIILAGPRGFCAGVDRAIRVVEEAIRQHGAPVYVRHEIVHNRTVVEALEAQGAVFVAELDQVPADAHVVFSAHGVPKSVPAEAERRNLRYFDATCPLVSKVHREAERHFADGGSEARHILMIGHAGHPEVVGTMGQLPPGSVTLVQSSADAGTVQPPKPDRLAFITQTTLSVDDTAEIVAVLRRRFPAIEGPKREDICYATTNRQAAVKAVAPECDLVLVIGSANSSNSQRLREVAERAGRRGLRLLTVGPGGETIDLKGRSASPLGQTLILGHGGKEWTLKLPLIGAYQAANALTAAGLAIATGSDLAETLAHLARVQPVRGRLERAAISRAGAPIYVDYAHTPDALAAAIEALNRTGNAVISFTPARSHASIIACASSTLVASGFSQSTCLPASAAAIVISLCRTFSEQTTTASISSRFTASR